MCVNEVKYFEDNLFWSELNQHYFEDNIAWGLPINTGMSITFGLWVMQEIVDEDNEKLKELRNEYGCSNLLSKVQVPMKVASLFCIYESKSKQPPHTIVWPKLKYFYS